MLIAREVVSACRLGVQVLLARFYVWQCHGQMLDQIFKLIFFCDALGRDCCWRSQFLLWQHMGDCYRLR